MSIENVLDAAQLTLSVCSLAQQKSYSHKKRDYSTKRHEEILDVHKKLHDARVELGKSVYKAEAIYSYDEHILSLDSDLLHNSKESERDMFDQRIQLYETVIFAASVIFGSLATLIIQGILPDSAANVIIILYSLFSALSFFFLLLCIVICIRVTNDAMHFMYKRTNYFNKKIVGPILKEDVLDLLSLRLKDTKSAEAVSHMFKEHTKKVNEKLQQKRIKMFKVYQDFNESFSVRLKYSDFQKYWDDKCEDWGKIGILFLNFGTVFLLMALLVLMYAKWGNVYHSAVGAIVAVAIVLLGIVVFCVLNWRHVVVKKMMKIWDGMCSSDDSSEYDDVETGV